MMGTLTHADYRSDVKPVWCPGCGDFGVVNALTKAFAKLELAPESVAVVSGIGCSSRIPAYTSCYGFHGVHGRALAAGTGLALVTTERIFGNAVTYRSDALTAVRTGAEVVLNPAEAARHGLEDGAAALLRSPHGECRLPVRTDADHPEGAAFVATGVPGSGVERLLAADRGPVRVEVGTA